jgi:hypothetical protein
MDEIQQPLFISNLQLDKSHPLLHLPFIIRVLGSFFQKVLDEQ